MFIGSLPANDLSIAGGKPYVFTFGTFSSVKTIQTKMPELAAYAKDIFVSDTGFREITVQLTPLYPMPLSAWKNLFSGVGLGSMNDVYAGAFSKVPDEGFTPVKNIKVYWEPKIESAKKALDTGLDKTFQTLKVVAIIAVTGVIGAVGLHGYMQGRGGRVINRNPKRRKK